MRFGLIFACHLDLETCCWNITMPKDLDPKHCKEDIKTVFLHILCVVWRSVPERPKHLPSRRLEVDSMRSVPNHNIKISRLCRIPRTWFITQFVEVKNIKSSNYHILANLTLGCSYQPMWLFCSLHIKILKSFRAVINKNLIS